ncbi:hypothetical protein Tco_1173643 [Tanacetum coccineum]
MSEVEQDDWSMEFDAEHVHFGQDGLGVFDWSNNADDAPASLALMATKSEETLVPSTKRGLDIPSSVLTREGLKKYCQTKNCTARPRVPQAVLSRSTGRPYYPRMDNRRPSISSYSPSSRQSKKDLKDLPIIDSVCSGSMTGDKNKLSRFQGYKGYIN